MDDQPDSPHELADGTQAIARAMAIVRTVARHGNTGVSLGTICEEMKLSRSTAHRILKRLVDERLLRVENRKYMIDSLAFEISLCVLNSYHFSSRFSELVGRVSRRTGHCTYLMVRSGADAVCLQTADGTARLRVTPVDVGQRRPLGVGAGGLALLSAFAPPAIEDCVRASALDLRTFNNLAPDRVLEAALAARERGYSISEGVLFPDTVGIGLLIPEREVPYMAISIAMPASAVGARSLGDYAGMIREEIESALREIRNSEQPAPASDNILSAAR